MARVDGHARTRRPPIDPLPSRNERRAAGKALREKVPREQHGDWKPAHRRPDPVGLIIESSKGRIPELIPIRNGRMSQSAFAFYRGTATIMAADLASTPSSGIQVQLCGDCHLLNFGAFATPERRNVFDINDFDETLPGPWEWDVKRLAASFVLASRANGFTRRQQRDAVLACMRSYRKRMAEFAVMPAISVWYGRIETSDVIALFHDKVSIARLTKRLAKEAARDVVEDDFPKLAERSGGRHVFKDNPPLIYHERGQALKTKREMIEAGYKRYRATLSDDRRVLLSRYRLADYARKVVGVGSVGTFCSIMLMMAEDDDPLILQIKQARASVLEPYLRNSRYPNHGQRVVEGQRLMQSASDIFLGWTRGRAGRNYYIRQLRDMKVKPLVEVFNPVTMNDYGALCGWALARAHARTGDAAMISGYLGKSDVFDRAIARFAITYADLAERDHEAFMAAIRKGRIEIFLEH